MLIELPNLKFSVLLHTEYQCHPVYIWWLRGKESTCNARDVGSIPGKIPGEGNGNPPQNSCLGNPMGRGAWWATVHGVTKESDRTK